MAPKKKKGGKKKKDKGVDKVPKVGEEEKKEEVVKEPEHGYVNVQVRIQHPNASIVASRQCAHARTLPLHSPYAHEFKNHDG